MATLIKQARVVDPANDFDEVCDLLIEAGRIKETGRISGSHGDDIIDAEGLLALPGLIDIGVYLREPGYEFKATIASEVAAAAACGITTLCAMPEFHPGVATSATANLVRQRAESVGKCEVLIIGAMTVGLEGAVLSEMAALKEAGCIAVSNAQRPFSDANFLRCALQYAASLDMPVFLAPIDPALAADGCAHEGAVATRLGLPGIPASAETAALGQYLALAEDTGARIHFCRLSCARSVEMIKQARDSGLQVTTDVCAHQLFLTENDVIGFDPNYRLLPPAREAEDRAALRTALARGDVEIVCSDHQPHNTNAKLAPFPAAAPGISSLETLLPLMLELADRQTIPLATAIASMTCNPARLLRIDRGNLSIGAAADLCLVDPDQEWELRRESMLSKGKNTPFSGKRFKGKVRRTIRNGVTVHGD